MKPTFLLPALASIVIASQAQSGDLEIDITGFPTDDGMARIVLMSGPDEYAGKAPVTLTDSVPIVDGKARWVKALPSGRYAVIAHHDGNSNDELDRPVFQLPVEAYGYSNGAWTSFGLPDFDQTAFVVAEETSRQTISVRYNAIYSVGQTLLVAMVALMALFGGATIVRRCRNSAVSFAKAGGE